MKCAIIAPGFTGATLPLAQHLSEMGHEVVCYYLSETGGKMIESLDFDSPLTIRKLIINISQSNSLYNYLNRNIKVSIVPVFRRRRTLSKVLIGKIPAIINYYRIQKFCRYVESQQYDAVNIVYHNEITLQICQFFDKHNIPYCKSYHEVVENLINPQKRIDIEESLKSNRPIIVHSQKTRNDLVNYYHVNNDDERLHVIYFGPFESYWQYGEGHLTQNVGKDYILFLGRITYYKGLKNLYSAVVKTKEDEVRIVVAGKGTDPILDKIRKNSHYYLVNRFIGNEELVYLIKNCKAVVCPYLAASQSGLVQTAFAFRKPVIATNVGAFSEFVCKTLSGRYRSICSRPLLWLTIRRLLRSAVLLQKTDCFPGTTRAEGL